MKDLNLAISVDDTSPSVGWVSDQPAVVSAGVPIPTLLWVAILAGIIVGIFVTNTIRS